MYFADTSFLCSLLRPDNHTAAADACLKKCRAPLSVSELVVLEFEHAARLQTFRFGRDRTQGYSKQETKRMIAALHESLSAGVLQLQPIDWNAVMLKASELSDASAVKHGHRLADTLHVATAFTLHAKTFLTFDDNQALLARYAGLRVLP